MSKAMILDSVSICCCIAGFIFFIVYILNHLKNSKVLLIGIVLSYACAIFCSFSAKNLVVYKYTDSRGVTGYADYCDTVHMTCKVKNTIMSVRKIEIIENAKEDNP